MRRVSSFRTSSCFKDHLNPLFVRRDAYYNLIYRIKDFSSKRLVMPSPFPTLAPCVLISADTSVYVDFILIMVSESGGSSESFKFQTVPKKFLLIMLLSRDNYDSLEMLFTVFVFLYQVPCIMLNLMMTGRASRSTLMKALLQDGIQYFICMFRMLTGPVSRDTHLSTIYFSYFPRQSTCR